MIQWFNQLNGRERYILIAGAMLSLILLVYALAWQPFITSKQDVESSIIAQQATLAWMRQTAAEIQQLRQQANPKTSTTGNQSLLSMIDTALNQGALAKVPKRIEPQGEDSVRVNFDEVNFTALNQWLADLYNRYGIQVATSTIERQRSADRVKARLLLY